MTHKVNTERAAIATTERKVKKGLGTILFGADAMNTVAMASERQEGLTKVKTASEGLFPFAGEALMSPNEYKHEPKKDLKKFIMDEVKGDDMKAIGKTVSQDEWF